MEALLRLRPTGGELDRQAISSPRRCLQESVIELHDQAMHDALAGLPNWRLLTERFGQALRFDARTGTSTGLLLFDLDRFKEVNDTFGHHFGDEPLQQVGPRVVGLVRKPFPLRAAPSGG